MSTNAACRGKNAPANSMSTGRRALHDMKGVISTVMMRLLRLSMVRVAIIAGTLHPNPMSMGMNDFPCSPILCMSLSIMNAARAIYPESSINEMKLLGEDIVTTAAPMITQALGVLSDVVHTLADAWANMHEEQQQNIIKMAGIAAAVGPVVSAVGTLGTGIGSMVGTAGKIMQFLPTIGTALTTVGTALTATVIPAVTAGASAFAAFIVPILPIVAAIGAVVAAGVALYKHWDDVKEAAGIVGDWIGEKWNGIKEKTSEAWTNVKEKVSGVMESIGEKTEERLTNMAQAWQENGGGIKGTAAAMWTGITDHFRDSFNAIDKLTGGKLTEIKNKFVGKFKEIATGALDWGKDIIGNIADGITAFSAKPLETGAAAKRMNEQLAAEKFRSAGLEKQIFDSGKK